MEIPDPDFDQYELVIVHWEGQQHVTQVVKRIYDPDKNEWQYGVQGLRGLYSADVIDFKKEDRSDK